MILSRASFCIFLSYAAFFQTILASPWVRYEVTQAGSEGRRYLSPRPATDNTFESLVALVGAEALVSEHRGSSVIATSEIFFLNKFHFPTTSSSSKRGNKPISAPISDFPSSDSIVDRLTGLYEDFTANHFVEQLPAFIEKFCKRLYSIPVDETTVLDSVLFNHIKAFKLSFSQGKVFISFYLDFDEASDASLAIRLPFAHQISALFPSSISSLVQQSYTGFLDLIRAMQDNLDGDIVSRAISGSIDTSASLPTTTVKSKSGKSGKKAPGKSSVSVSSSEEQEMARKAIEDSLIAEEERSKLKKQKEAEKKQAKKVARVEKEANERQVRESEEARKEEEERQRLAEEAKLRADQEKHQKEIDAINRDRELRAEEERKIAAIAEAKRIEDEKIREEEEQRRLAEEAKLRAYQEKHQKEIDAERKIAAIATAKRIEDEKIRAAKTMKFLERKAKEEAEKRRIAQEKEKLRLARETECKAREDERKAKEAERKAREDERKAIETLQRAEARRRIEEAQREKQENGLMTSEDRRSAAIRQQEKEMLAKQDKEQNEKIMFARSEAERFKKIADREECLRMESEARRIAAEEETRKLKVELALLRMEQARNLPVNVPQNSPVSSISSFGEDSSSPPPGFSRFSPVTQQQQFAFPHDCDFISSSPDITDEIFSSKMTGPDTDIDDILGADFSRLNLDLDDNMEPSLSTQSNNYARFGLKSDSISSPQSASTLPGLSLNTLGSIGLGGRLDTSPQPQRTSEASGLDSFFYDDDFDERSLIGDLESELNSNSDLSSPKTALPSPPKNNYLSSNEFNSYSDLSPHSPVYVQRSPQHGQRLEQQPIYAGQVPVYCQDAAIQQQQQFSNYHHPNLLQGPRQFVRPSQQPQQLHYYPQQQFVRPVQVQQQQFPQNHPQQQPYQPHNHHQAILQNYPFRPPFNRR